MPQTKVAWSVDAIGDAAGQVWSCLKQRGTCSVAAIEGELDAPKPLAVMAIGWLAREGKISLQPQGRSISVRLTE